MSKIKETKVYNINDFLNWFEAGELEISPKYQRNSVWNYKAKSYFIDTIIKGFPVPQVLIRQVIDTNTRKTMREVVDGQQRLRTIIEFIDNQFSIAKVHNPELANKNYDDLYEEEKEALLSYELPVEIIKVKDDSLIYDMFARLNTNSVTLNQQELRNAKYWGDFKVFVYRQSAKWRSFFIDIKTFNDSQLSRMLDIEFLSSIVILLIDGVINETPTTINNYYKKYDEEFNELDQIESRLNDVLDVIKHIFESRKFNTRYFYRKNYFFTLFCAITSLMYDVPNLDNETGIKLPKEAVIDNLNDIVKKIMQFESYFERFMNDELFNQNLLPDMVRFEQNHRTRTTSLTERKERINILLRYIGVGSNG